MLWTTKFLPKHGSSVLLSLYLIFFLFRFALVLLDVPKVRLIEQVVCQQYFQAHPPLNIDVTGLIPETQCKLLPIQKEVATITGWRLSFDALPG